MAQFNTGNNSFQAANKTLFEVNQIATANGSLVTNTNPFPVTLGSQNITITGNVNVGTTVSVNSTPEDPVHTHITEVGNSGLLTVSYMPIGGNVVVTSGNVAVTGSVNVGNFPPSQNVVVTSGSFAFDPLASDAFGRLRMSAPLTLFDSSHRYRDNGLWVTSNTAGATYAHTANQGLVDLNLPTTANAEIIRETTKVFAYQPGKSLLVLNTFVATEPKANLRQRIGYFGAQNGIYFEIDGITAYFVKRSYVTGSVVETRVAQADWNNNTLSSLDLSKAHIMWMDIEWLGVGSVRCGFVIDGNFIHCHSFHHANLITSTYITTASLPVRYEIKNTGTTASNSTLKQVCSTVISEGGYELRGLQQAATVPITAPVDLPTAGTYYNIISIRLKASPNRLDAIVILTALSVLGITNNVNYNWQVRASGTSAGSTWTDAGADSSVEYKIGGGEYSGGRILASGYTSGSNQGSTSVDILKEALFKFQLERNGLTNTPFELSLIASASTNGGDIFGSMDWEEISR